MARRTVVTLEDDIDGSVATGTVTFSLDGTAYEIDLNDVHAADLRDVLAPYAAAARATGGRRTPSRARPATEATGPGRRPPAPEDVDPKTVRAWAAANGVPVSGRGRVKAEVVERYRAATG